MLENERRALAALEALEERKAVLINEELDLEDRADDAISDLFRSLVYSLVFFSSVIMYLQIGFVGISVLLVFGVFWMFKNAVVATKEKIRRMTHLIEDIKKMQANVIEDAYQLAVELKKSQKALKCKVTPVKEDDLPVNADGIANLNIFWLWRQESFEKRLEYVRTVHDFRSSEVDRMLLVNMIAAFGMLILSCFVIGLYYVL
ncbi:hypothetical protein ACH5RR_005921 [Cinchona calisaya]|uniref:Uncharacterized protein n=1 Tax=Cinchona calisaya TaxID=153742 RepID=A0ABD3AMH7_9GENT